MLVPERARLGAWLGPAVILGGLYLSYEGAEKIHHALANRRAHREETPAEHLAEDVATESVDENKVIAEAVRTDLILSTEIMVISLQTVDHEPFLTRTIVLIVVAFLITALVYGVVALIVKMDDVGLHLAKKNDEGSAGHTLGRGMVKAMPKILQVISVVGTVAMLWVGGHIILVGLDEFGWHALYGFVHHMGEAAAHVVPVLQAAVSWIVNTFFSAVLGLIWGAIIVVVVTLIQKARGKSAH